MHMLTEGDFSSWRPGGKSVPLAMMRDFQIKSQQRSSLLLLHKLSCNLCTHSCLGAQASCSATPKSELTRGGWGAFCSRICLCAAAVSVILDAEDLGASSAHPPPHLAKNGTSLSFCFFICRMGVFTRMMSRVLPFSEIP